MAPNAQVEQANGLKYKMRPIMDWDYLIKIARDDGNTGGTHSGHGGGHGGGHGQGGGKGQK